MKTTKTKAVNKSRSQNNKSASKKVASKKVTLTLPPDEFDNDPLFRSNSRSLKPSKTPVQTQEPLSLVRREACQPPHEWFTLDKKDYTPEEAVITPAMKEYFDRLDKAIDEGERKLIEKITDNVVNKITRLLESGEIKIPEKEISFTIRPEEVRKPIGCSMDEMRKRHQPMLENLGLCEPKKKTKKRA